MKEEKEYVNKRIRPLTWNNLLGICKRTPFAGEVINGIQLKRAIL